MASTAPPEKCRLALGYSGWGPKQLEAELRENVWLVVEPDEEIIFDSDFSGKWERALRKEERFRAFYTHMWDKNSQRQSRCAYSADGIHWHAYDELPEMGIAGPRLCDVTIVMYDEDARTAPRL